MSKHEIRKIMCTKRKQLSLIEKNQASVKLACQLKSYKYLQRATNIAVYLAVNGEIGLQPFIDWCWRNHKHVYVPVVQKYPKRWMQMMRYKPKQALALGKYQILQPQGKLQAHSVLNLDVILLPLVAFDVNGGRLGMGGGFYDRFLQNVKHKAKPYLIGVAYDWQQVSCIPSEKWDIPLHTVITNSNIFTC